MAIAKKSLKSSAKSSKKSAGKTKKLTGNAAKTQMVSMKILNDKW